MQKEFLFQQIVNKCDKYDVVILKGFNVKDVLKLESHYEILDKDYFIDGKIAIDKMTQRNLTKKLMLCEGKCVMTFDTLVFLSFLYKNLDEFELSFCILENNLIGRYENPSNVTIPDFDSSEFQNSEEGNEKYCNFYSFCEQKNGKQYVRYILPDFEHPVEKKCLFDIEDINFEEEALYSTFLSSDNETIDVVSEELNETGTLRNLYYSIDEEDRNNKRIKILKSAAKAFGIDLHFSVKRECSSIEVRTELKALLKEIWGYESFRELEFYKELPKSHDIYKVSQGEIIENVIRQSEKSTSSIKEYRNILLTSPTGAGKSLLFQLAAIYLAKCYGYVTIVVSPLVALMDDQVMNLKDKYEGVAALNGNRTAEEREEILNKTKTGEISLLYLAPELLLSYTVQTFIGERRLGLLVVDEAHTVTTWGRDFRVDYWFLGDYIRKMRRQLAFDFPVFALTATAVWDPSHKNDMVFDTISSLHMNPCIQYIGVVRRKNIRFDISQVNISGNYEQERTKLTINRIKESVVSNTKTIVYFPFVTSITKLLRENSMELVKSKVTAFYGRLSSEEKTENSEDFRTGRKPVMCATKAYGMGVDVSDIEQVYHHAPSGTLSDYVQEIGRVAREQSMTGIAKLDFSEKDFKYRNILHGLSAIKLWQVKAVLKKLMILYNMGREKRNMLISAEDFSYIFPKAKDETDLDQKVKCCLMLISHDLYDKLNFPAIIVRPKSMFSTCYIQVESSQKNLFETCYGKYLNEIEGQPGVYKLLADQLWSDKFCNMSFAQFKKHLADRDLLKQFKLRLKKRLAIETEIATDDIRRQLNVFFDRCEKFLNIMNQEHRRVKVEEMRTELLKEFGKVRTNSIINAFTTVFASSNCMGNPRRPYCSVYNGEEPEKMAFQLSEGSYNSVRVLYMNCFDNSINNLKGEHYCDANSNQVKLCGLMECLNLVDYSVTGGECPMIFVRINNPYQIRQIVKSDKYENDILKGIYEKFELSERIFSYFFTTDMTDEERWDFIEEYFLGATEDKLLNFV